MNTKKILLAFAAMLLPLVASAVRIKVGELYYSLNINNQTACVVNGSGLLEDGAHILYYSGDITIPETVTYEGIEYTVTSIEGGHKDPSFMPYNTQSFEDSGITSIRIPKTITIIEPYTFRNCRNLTTVIFDGDVTSIGDGAFYGAGLTSFTFPNTVTSVGGMVLSECNNLVTVTFHCKEIKDWVSFNKFIKEVIIGNEVESIGGGAFWGCSGLTSVTIPENVTSIGEAAFSGCSGLTSVTIPNSVTSIDYHTFSGCSGLTSVTIPNSVTSIAGRAFNECSGLTSVSIPSSVTFIGDFAFSGCSGLRDVYCEGMAPNIRHRDRFLSHSSKMSGIFISG